MDGNANESVETLLNKLENTRKSRDEFKAQLAVVKKTAEYQAELVKEQRMQIAALIDAVCELSKAVGR